ncbi:MAG TPA: hypothetical protein VFT13_01045 [Candidatus Krumholzibacteria bacterium]|nr:hypothetical protein [Candidatus Krumholzibacteria bacterium]
MRTHSRLIRVPAVAVLLVGLLLAVAGCPKHENFPQPLNVQSVPTPDSLVITRPDPQGTDYDFAWYVTDPEAVVDHVRIYLLGEGFVPDELIAETSDNPFKASFATAATGLRFAVSAVSTENVEGARRVAVAP